MKKKKLGIISILLVFSMLISMCNTTVLAKSSDKAEEIAEIPEDFKYSISNDRVTITGYEGDGGDIKIPDVIEDCNVTEIESSAFYGVESITTIILPSSLTEVGDAAFRNCTNITSINIPEQVKNIGNNAFRGCTSLKEVEVHNDVIIGSSCFRECTSLEKVKTGDDVTIKRYAFQNCTAIEELIFGRDVNRETGSFYESVVISGDCENEVSYTLDIETGEMSFSGNGDIPDYSLNSPAPWGKFSSVVNYLNIGEGISAIGDYAFTNFNNIESVVLPNGVKKVGESAFYSCAGLSYIEIPDSVESINDAAFDECGALNEMVFGGNAPVFGKNAVKNGEGLNIYYPVTATGWGNLLQQTYNLCKWQTWDNTVPKRDIVLLLDVSGSMSGKINKLREAAQTFIDGMVGRRLNTRISVISYESSAKLVSGFTTNKLLLAYQLGKLSAGGGTKYTRALDAADNLLKNSDADQKSIVMFSDGEPNDSTSSIYSLADKLRDTYTIYAVGLLSSDSQRNILKKVAGGDDRYFEADQIKDLLEAFSQLVKDFGREENTTAKIQRHNVTYDLLKGKTTFCVGSLEYAAIAIVPGSKLGDFSRVDLLKGDSVVESSENGIFNNIQPGRLFEKNDKIFAAIYDDEGNALEKISLKISIADAYSVKFMLNDGTNKVYKIDTAVGGLDIKEPDAPVRDGYKFKGWYATKDCVGISFFNILNSLNRLNIEGDITLYAKWVSDMKEDIWSFTNSSTYFCPNQKKEDRRYEISSGDFAKLIEPLDSASADNMKNYKNETEWGGSCFGMSSTVVLNRTDVINISDFDAAYQNVRMAEIYENSNGDSDVGVIESMINYYHLRQRIGKVRRIRTSYSETDESSNLRNIINKLESSKEPCIVTIILSGDDESGGHAVVGYDLEKKNDTEFKFKVYDCAHGPNEVYVVNVKVNAGKYSADCHEWENAWKSSGYNNIFFKTALTSEDLISERYLTAPSVINKRSGLKAENEEKYFLNTSYGVFNITDGTSSAIIADGKLISGNLDIVCRGAVNDVGQNPEYEFELPILPDGKQYTINIEDQQAAAFDTSLFYENVQNGFYAKAFAKEGGKIIFSADGGVRTEYHSDIEQYLTVATNKSKMPWASVTFKGLSNGMAIMPDSEKYALYSDINTDIDVTVKSKFNQYTFKDITLSKQESEVVENEKGDCEIRCGGKEVASKAFGYAVVFDSQAGSNVDTLYCVEKGSKISEPAEPRRAGYMFAGWFKDVNCTERWDFDKDVINSDTVLHAGWELDGNYFITVTFKLKGADNQIITLPQGSVLHQDDCPKNSGGENLTWYTDNGCLVKWDFNNAFQMNTVLYSEGWDNSSAEATSTPLPNVPSGGTGNLGPTIVATPSPSVVPTPSPSPSFVPTPVPTALPTPTLKPSTMPSPSATLKAENDNKAKPAKKLKKGIKIKDKKTKAIYKITSLGKNKTAEYVKSTQKNAASISIPSVVKLKGKNFKVTSVGKSAFKNNKKLKKVKLGKNIRLVGKQAFSGCKKLKNVAIGSNVTTIGANAFSGCTNLTLVTIPSKVKKIGTKAFYKCKNLKYIMVKTKKLTLNNVGRDAFSGGYHSPRIKTAKNIWKQYSVILLQRGISRKALFLIDPAKLVI